MRSRSAGVGVRGRRPHFPRADWLWQPIPASPVIDAQSSTIVAALATTGGQIIDLVDFGVTMKSQAEINASTPRYTISFSMANENGGDWGPSPFTGLTMPIPLGTQVPPGSDAHLSVIDGATNKSYSLWQAHWTGSAWQASWGAWADLNGDGREDLSGTSTATGLARYGAVITLADIAAGHIDHALFFSSSITRNTAFRYPAVKTDGDTGTGSSTIMEGTRVQLDPTINLAAISGITSAELTIGRALQTYGAYCGDKGGAKMAFIAELAPDYVPGGSPGSVYNGAGLIWDYFALSHIPWSSLRVLNSWNGT
jgi:hypothetical protein